MQNIDALYFLTPIAVIAFSFGLVAYWRIKKKSFTKWVLIYSLVAYAGAIAAKAILQFFTISYVSNSAFELGIYYGTQTALFEVGRAFLVAAYAFRRGRFGAKDAEGYGLGLAMWENGVLIAIPLLVDYAAYYFVLSNPSLSAASTVYSILIKNEPSLFYGPSQALPLIGFSILERVSSLLAHFSWGYLAVLSAVLGKKKYILVALPIGFLIDFLVPFSSAFGLALFELIVFLVALCGFIAAMLVTRRERLPQNEEEKQEWAAKKETFHRAAHRFLGLSRNREEQSR